MKIFAKCRRALALVIMCCMMLTSFGVNAFASDVAEDTVALSETTYTESGLKDGDDDITITGALTGTTFTPSTPGVLGKAADDLVYKLDFTGDTQASANYYKVSGGGGTDVTFEYSVALPDGYPVGLYMRIFTTETCDTSDGKVDTVPLFVKGDGVYLSDETSLVPKELLGTKIADCAQGQWVNIAVVIPGYKTNNVKAEEFYVYVNGVKYTIPVDESFNLYGLQQFRLAPSGETITETKTVYYDNLRCYTGNAEVYDPAKDARPVVDFGTLEVTEGKIKVPTGTTLDAFKALISTSANVRAYSDNTYATALTGTDLITASSVLVLATNNSRTTERAYSYYTFELFEAEGGGDEGGDEGEEEVYTEDCLLDGDDEITLKAYNTEGSGATLTVGHRGVYGKAPEDLVYRLDFTGVNSTGKNYYNEKATGYDATFEFQTLLTESHTLGLWMRLYSDPEDLDVYTNGTILEIRYDGVYLANHSFISTEQQKMKIADYTPGTWVNIAVVIPGYSSNNVMANEFYVYVNGAKTTVSLNTPIAGMQQLRLAPAGDDLTETKTIYYDNFRFYSGKDVTEVYAPAKDALPVVDLGENDVYAKNINVSEGTTVEDFKASVTGDATVRVFEDDSYTTVLSDTDVMGKGNVVVFAAANKRTTERTYLFYTVNLNHYISGGIRLVNQNGKVINGSKKDLDNAGEKYWLDTKIFNNSSKSDNVFTAIVASYDEDGKMLCYEEKPMPLAPGENVFGIGNTEVYFEDIVTPKGGTLKAFIWYSKNNEPLCKNLEVVFNAREEYHVLALSNSYGQDAFRQLPSVAKAAGVDLYAVASYRGGCSFAQHFEYMNGNGTYPSRTIYYPDGTKSVEENVSFDDVLNTPGFTWDHITLQSRSVEAYDYATYWKPYLVQIADYIKEAIPTSEVMMYQTWVRDSDTAQTDDYTAYLIEGLEYEQIRPKLFETLKANYFTAAEAIGNPGRIVPVGEAVNYAVGTLGFPEYEKDADGNYLNSRGMYKDKTCHLTTLGQALNALTWYEYITGNDARENPYQHESISEEDMALLKEAAHWACSQEEYIKF